MDADAQETGSFSGQRKRCVSVCVCHRQEELIHIALTDDDDSCPQCFTQVRKGSRSSVDERLHSQEIPGSGLQSTTGYIHSHWGAI